METPWFKVKNGQVIGVTSEGEKPYSLVGALALLTRELKKSQSVAHANEIFDTLIKLRDAETCLEETKLIAGLMRECNARTFTFFPIR
jgi:hypothetical protein